MTSGPRGFVAIVPRLLLLGRPEFVGAAVPVAFAPERRFQLLALLAVQAGQWVSRDRLAALLWPERSNTEARRNLRHVVFKARDLAGDLQASDHALCWEVATDLRAFEQQLDAGQPAQAVALRRGALLEGLDDDANPAFAEWLAAERQRFDARWRQAALQALAGAAADQRIELARHLRSVDPLDEDALEAQLRAHIALGHPARAWQLYREHAQALAEALGVEPPHRLRDLLEREAPVGGGVATPSAPPASEAAAFVGRRSELAELKRLLEGDGARAITLVGPGGVGKSTLARRALQAAAEAFPGGRAWVELQDLGEPGAVLARIADQLGVPIDDARDPVAQIGRKLGAQRVLCVLDNAEHLAELPGLIERLLAAAPALRLLTTSRVRLGHAGEHLLPLAGLAVPDEDSRDLDAAGAFDAVRLFEQRASAAQRSFSLARHLGAVIDIVQAVGGLPLAIELAAGWVRLLPPEEIAQDLRRSIDLLERDPAAAAPARPEHDSARAVLERSWSLLAPREREALAALAVFQGGFTRAAALAVAQVALPLLSSLVDKSLLAVDEAGRFGLHPLVAAFAAQRLASDGARADELAQRHAAHYAQYLAELPARAGTDPRLLAESIESDYANYRAAWHHAVVHGSTEALARSTEPWRRYFEVRGRKGEGIGHFQSALDAGPPGHDRQSLGADVRAALSQLHYLLGEQQSGLAIALAGAEMAEQSGNRRALYGCLNIAGGCYCAQGRGSDAKPCFERALAIGRAAGAIDEIANALNNLGIVAKLEGRYDEAIGHYGQALSMERVRGRHTSVVRTLGCLAGLHLARRDWSSARDCSQEGLRLSERHRIEFFVPIHAGTLGQALLELGQLDDAERHLQRSIDSNRGIGSVFVEIGAAVELARLALRRGDSAAALQRLRTAGRIARERDLAKHALDVAVRFGDWLLHVGHPVEAARVWRMVGLHPQADAASRDQAQRSISDLADPTVTHCAQVEHRPISLDAVMDRLLSDQPLVSTQAG